MAIDEWFIVYHDVWKKPAALVGLKNNQFIGYIPLLDDRDTNGDGKVSMGEWIFSKMPIYGHLSRQVEISKVMMMVGMHPQVNNAQLILAGQQNIYASAMVAVKKSISMLYIKKLAGPAAELALLGTKMTGVSYFIAKKGLEQVFQMMIDRAIDLP